jgi:hypothetical protein
VPAQIGRSVVGVHARAVNGRPPAPILTAFTDASPCPRVQIRVPAMPPLAATITVWRTWSGRRSQVRDAVDAPVSGPYFVTDYEVPLGVPVTYTCETKTAGGTPSELSDGATTTVNVSSIWMQDALDPTTAIEVQPTPGITGIRAIGDSFAPLTYELSGEVLPVVGSREPIAVGGTRRAASKVPLSVTTWSQVDTDKVRTLWSQAFPLCARTPSSIPQHGGLVYLAFTGFTEAPYPGWAGTLFATVGDAVRGPGRGIVVQPRTYAHLLDEASTYAGLLTLYPTYLDVRRGP